MRPPTDAMAGIALTATNRLAHKDTLGAMTKTVNDLNPRAQAVKANEMAVRRALELIEAFDELESDQDWTDVPGATYRRVLGHTNTPSPKSNKYQEDMGWKHGDRWYDNRAVLSECWKRYKDATLYSQVWDLAQNLPDSVLKKKELKDGIDKVRDRLDS